MRAARAPAGGTPSWFIQPEWFLALELRLLRARLIPRPFDMDPFGHPEAPISRIIRRRGGVVLTGRSRQDDGLLVSWRGRVALPNPPYDADFMEAAAAKMGAEADTGHVVGLVPAWTDRDWWQNHLEPRRLGGSAVVRFLAGRLFFGWPGNPLGLGGDSAMFPSALVFYRPPGRWPIAAAATINLELAPRRGGP